MRIVLLAFGALALVSSPLWGFMLMVLLNVGIGEVTARWPPGRPDQVRAKAESVLSVPSGLTFEGVELPDGEMGVGPWCAVYQTTTPMDTVLATYRTEFAQRGWQIAADVAVAQGSNVHHLLTTAPDQPTITLDRPGPDGAYRVFVCSSRW